MRPAPGERRPIGGRPSLISQACRRADEHVDHLAGIKRRACLGWFQAEQNLDHASVDDLGTGRGRQVLGYGQRLDSQQPQVVRPAGLVAQERERARIGEEARGVALVDLGADVQGGQIADDDRRLVADRRQLTRLDLGPPRRRSLSTTGWPSATQREKSGNRSAAGWGYGPSSREQSSR